METQSKPSVKARELADAINAECDRCGGVLLARDMAHLIDAALAELRKATRELLTDEMMKRSYMPVETWYKADSLRTLLAPWEPESGDGCAR